MHNRIPLFVLVVLFACSQEDESPVFKQRDFTGEWVLSRSTLSTDQRDSCRYSQFHDITQSRILIVSACETADTVWLDSLERNYAFDGRNKIFFPVDSTYYLIQSISADKLELDFYSKELRRGRITLRPEDSI